MVSLLLSLLPEIDNCISRTSWRIWLSITRTGEQQYVGYKVYWDGLTRTRGDFYTGSVANNRKGIEDIIH